MPIKIIEGRILCSKCEKLMEDHESFKLNEYQYEIACLDCDEKYNFSKDNYVDFNTTKKQHLLRIIFDAWHKKRTICIDLKEERKKLVDILSAKVKSLH